MSILNINGYIYSTRLMSSNGLCNSIHYPLQEHILERPNMKASNESSNLLSKWTFCSNFRAFNLNNIINQPSYSLDSSLSSRYINWELYDVYSFNKILLIKISILASCLTGFADIISFRVNQKMVIILRH